MSIEEKLGVDTISVRATNAWREWVNIMHGEVPTTPLPEDMLKAFKKIWYGEGDEPALEFAKWLIQQAFITGFHEGFTNRIVKGDVNEHTK